MADGVDFYLGERELGHIHTNGEVHLPVTQKLAEVLIDHEIADDFPYGDGWISFFVRDKKGADLALRLFKLNFKRLKKAKFSVLKQDALALAQVI